MTTTSTTPVRSFVRRADLAVGRVIRRCRRHSAAPSAPGIPTGAQVFARFTVLRFGSYSWRYAPGFTPKEVGRGGGRGATALTTTRKDGQ